MGSMNFFCMIILNEGKILMSNSIIHNYDFQILKSIKHRQLKELA